jgi:spermidine/putrescine ABC transporter ATP-binding subunit
MAAVEVIQIEKAFQGSRAVDGVSLSIGTGEFVTLLGPSGCGKTTTLRMIAGLTTPDRGRIAIGGNEVTQAPAYRRNIGMVFQSHALFPHMTVAENVGFGLRMRGMNRAARRPKVAAALEMVQLGSRMDHFPSQLSGGQQQRIALARALVFDPDVLLLDEPFGALDRRLRELMQDELRELTRRLGTTAIFVTHDQEEALKMSDRVGVMSGGRLDQLASPAEIFERPITRFVAEFMGFGNIFDTTVTGPRGLALDGFALECGETLPQPGSATIAIRAERITLSQDAPIGPNRATGTVVRASYQGVLVNYRIRLDGPAEVLLEVRETSQSAGGRPRFPIGQRVTASWPREAVRVLSSDRGS